MNVLKSTNVKRYKIQFLLFVVVVLLIVVINLFDFPIVDTVDDLLNIGQEISYDKCLKPTTEEQYKVLTSWKLQPKKCEGNVTIILLVKSSIFRNSLRHTLRKTWAQEIDTEYGIIRRIFVMGSPVGDKPLSLIENESRKEKDILQGSFVDAYKSVTTKVVAGMHFIKQHCPYVKHIIIADDDAMIFPWNLLTFLNLPHKTGLNFGGFVMPRERPHRKKTVRYWVSFDEYSCKKYPPYPNGAVYIMSMNTLVTFCDLTRKISLFVWEDVYFGVLAKIANISLTGFPDDIFTIRCHDLFSVHNVESNSKYVACHSTDLPSDHIRLWSEFCYLPPTDETSKLLLLYCSNLPT